MTTSGKCWHDRFHRTCAACVAPAVFTDDAASCSRASPLGTANPLKRWGFGAWSHQHDFEDGDRDNSLDTLTVRNVADAEAVVPLHASSQRLE
jgi:hypothetical protein